MRAVLSLGIVALVLCVLVPPLEGAPLPIGPTAGLLVGASTSQSGNNILSPILSPVSQVAAGTKKLVSSVLPGKSTTKSSAKSQTVQKSGPGRWFPSKTTSH